MDQHEKGLNSHEDEVVPTGEQGQAQPVANAEPQGPVAPADGLAVMDEIYEAGGSDESSDLDDDSLDEAPADEEGPELESTLVELLDKVQECLDTKDEPRADNEEPRLVVAKEFAEEAVNLLVSQGTLMFLGKYLLNADEANGKRYTAAELLSALGFELPLSVVHDPKYTSQHFEVALQIAIRYTLRNRRRLPEPRTLQDVVDHIQRAQRILVVTGAGISTSLGIPDFRSDNGLYAQLEHIGLADPQEVFDIRTFREDPAIFYSVASKILPETDLHVGTPTHKFIKLLHDHGKLLRNYTQNIDNLEQYIGLPAERVVQCHGSFGSAHCVTCGLKIPDGEQLFPAIKQGAIPQCPECAKRKEQGKRKKSSRSNGDSDEEDAEDASYGVLKPDITFFGEALPARFDNMLFNEGDAFNCDLVICMGTSLRVSPVSEIVKVVPRQVPQIYISKTPAKHLVFEVSFLGGCDDTVELLCKELGWNLDHPMNRRSPDMPADKFPGGTVESNDGVIRLVSDDSSTASPVHESADDTKASEGSASTSTAASAGVSSAHPSVEIPTTGSSEGLGAKSPVSKQK